MRLDDSQVQTQGTAMALVRWYVRTNGICTLCTNSLYSIHVWKYTHKLMATLYLKVKVGCVSNWFFFGECLST